MLENITFRFTLDILLYYFIYYKDLLLPLFALLFVLFLLSQKLGRNARRIVNGCIFGGVLFLLVFSSLHLTDCKTENMFDAENAMAHIKSITEIGPRPFNSDGEKEVAGYISRVFGETKLPGERSNVVVVKSGIGKPILVGAHYDTVPGAEGADDNGSGIGVLLELYRIVMKHNTARPVIFAAFTGEETGYIGSLGFIKENGEVEAAVIIDTVGTGENLLYSMGTRQEYTQPWLVEKMLDERASPTFYVLASDHMPFIRHGIPSVGVARATAGRFANIHTPQDSYEKLDNTKIREIGEYAERKMVCLANMKSPTDDYLAKVIYSYILFAVIVIGFVLMFGGMIGALSD